MRKVWFRPVFPCKDDWELWGMVWNWIGLALLLDYYPEYDRMQRFRQAKPLPGGTTPVLPGTRAR